MFDAKVCRVCLSIKLELHSITSTDYREMYEKLTGTKLDDGLPESLCFICHSQLRKCIQFIKTALKSYELLLQWNLSNTVINKATLANIETPYKLNSTPAEILSIDSETGVIQEENGRNEVNNTKDIPETQKLNKNTKDSIHNYHSLYLNDTSSNDTSVPNDKPSLLRDLLLSNDKSLNDRVANDISLNDTITNINSSNDEASNDNLLNDKVIIINDKSLNYAAISNDNSSSLRHLLVSDDKSTNDGITNDNQLNDTSNRNEKLVKSNNFNDKSINNDNDDENDGFSSSDDQILATIKPVIQTKGQFIEEQYKKLNVTVVNLDIERQRQEVASRLESDNYIHSEYRCDYCYRGFTAVSTFTKHMYKHSEEKSGKYECDICHYRYRIISKLRIHIENTHSRFYKCNTCGAMLHSLFEAKIHSNEHEGIKYACNLCSKEFKKRTSYFSHVRIKHSSKHICKICGKGFVSRMGLLQHVSKIHRGEITREKTDNGTDCYDCELNFVSLDALYRHRLDSPRHKNAWSHSTVCFVCHHDFKNKIILRKHLKEHRDKLLYNRTKEPGVKEMSVTKCDLCSKVFYKKNNLRMHMKTQHLNMKQNFNKYNIEDFMCEICGATLKSKGSLTSHRRIHTGERPYLCTTCPKSFNERGQLTLHYRTHTGYRPYTCGQCTKRFAQKTALNRHMRTHTGAKPYKCELCMKHFTQNNSLKCHIASVHFKLPTYAQRKREKEKNNKKDCEISEINV